LSTIQVKAPKVFKCYTCGAEIIFKTNEYETNKKGKKVPKRFNVDGTAHICDKGAREGYKQSDEYRKARSDKARRWWFGYGRYRYKYGYKDSYNKYNRREYDERWKENNKRREEYKHQYYNESLSVVEALARLNLNYDSIHELPKAEKFQAIKKAYREIALLFHPDRFNAKNPQATEAQKAEAVLKFRQGTEAFELLESKLNEGGF